jgi:EmrB/QacA subfamily drug resistance transporter
MPTSVSASTAPLAALPVDGPTPLPHRGVLIVFSGLLLAVLLAALDSTIVSTALPTIVGELGGVERLAWVVTAYLLAQTVVTPLYGKLGDLYGRKRVLQTAIVIFLIGSVLCGTSQNMTQLVVYRAIQGLGGGGLMVTSQAVVGDIVAPRDRGRYQGIFGAVFGVASVAGPLAGGYFTTHLSWRWIFYVNLPLGLLALAVIGAVLPTSVRRARRGIDWAGASLLAVALSAVTILTDLGGTLVAWASPTTIALAATSLLALGGFVLAERRADEPVLPLRLFENRAFAVASAVGLIVGFALFGSVTYLPLYLQVVQGASPTASGLQMLPQMGGMLATSILSGQVISRTGRYKLFPVLGTAVMTVGLFLLSRMGTDTTMPQAMGIMLTLGLGLGMVMQVLVLAVQNSVPYADLGVATSGATLFRLVGGSLGTAVLGAIFAARLRTLLADAGAASSGISPQALAQLSPTARAAYATAFTEALGTVFLVATVVAAVGFALAWLLPERPLRETVAATASDSGQTAGESFPMPTSDESAEHLVRGLSVLADRDVQRGHLQAILTRAGLPLSVAAAWLLIRIERERDLDPVALGRTHDVPADRMREAMRELYARGLVEPRVEGTPDPRDRRRRPPHELTAAGCDALATLVAARRARLTELLGDWEPERREQLAALLRRLARDLAPDAPTAAPRPAAPGTGTFGAS